MTGCHSGLLWSVQESWLADCRYDKMSVYRSGSCTALSRMEKPSSPVFLEIHKSTGWLLYVMDPCFLNSAEKGQSPGFFFFFMHKEYQILSICASCKETAAGTGQQDWNRSAVPNRNSPGSLSIPSIHSSASTAPCSSRRYCLGAALLLKHLSAIIAISFNGCERKEYRHHTLQRVPYWWKRDRSGTGR